MPTGYTAAIYDGIDFNTFVLGASRAMGALIHMRDSSGSAEITLPTPSDYHAVALKKARKRLMGLKTMTKKKKIGDSIESNKKALIAHNEYLSKCERQKSQLNDMLRQVDDWRPPTTDHIGFKEFMQSQIKETIKWDCSGANDTAPKDKTPDEWWDAQIKSANWDIEYHAKYIVDDDGRNEKRREWIIALFESLGMHDKVKKLKLVTF